MAPITMKNLPIASALACATVAACGALPAHSAIAPSDIADLSLEQLTRITVTSASRREEPLLDAPASIFVITAEDIRRSGATRLPEALRLAPNLLVARTDTSQYAISARGGNTTTANNMLVLIDGRTVYTPLYSGVFWDAQNILLEDIDRIEVVSGPATTLWGTNGVNGVINIVTLSAARTQGTLLGANAGDMQRGALVRYGGELGGGGYYRVYAKYDDQDSHSLASGADARDDAQRWQTGFRMDWNRGADAVTFQGDAYGNDIGNFAGKRDVSGSNVVARWLGKSGEDTDFRLQAYYDRTEREHLDSFKEKRDTFDLEYQRSTRFSVGHTFVWGAGYRSSRDDITNSPTLAFLPDSRTLKWGNLFAQDEFALRADLKATVGLRLETNSYTGHEWLPNVRLAWKPSPEHLVWGELSRAVRAPSRIDRDLYAPGIPPYLVLAGQDTFRAEINNIAELGYRGQVTPAASLSLTAFYHDLRDLRSIEANSDGQRVFANGIDGTTRGIEGWGDYRVTPRWRLSGGFLVLHEKKNLQSGRVDLGGLAALGNDPDRTAMLRSLWDITPRHELDLMWRYVGELPNPKVPSYSVLDARLGWRVSKNLDLSLVIQDAFDRKYSEFGNPATRAVLERAYFVKIAWRL
jgi:iron complex outermembrane recepter protein